MPSKIIVIWHNLNKDIYYYKIIKGTYFDYAPGYINQYNHEIVCVIKNIYTEYRKITFREKVSKKIISFLQKIIKFLER